MSFTHLAQYICHKRNVVCENKIACSLFVFAALNCDDMLSVSAAGLLCSGMNIPDPSDR